MNIFSIIGIAIIGITISILLSKYNSEYSLMITLITGIIILIWITINMIPILEKITYLFNKTNMPYEYGNIILKSLGITFITQFAADTCKDAGQTAISNKLELAGKITILIISLPLFEKILSIIYEIIL